MSQLNETIVRRFYREVLGQGRVGLVDELFAPDYLEHPASGKVIYANLEAAKVWFRAIQDAFPNRMVVIEDVRTFDDAVVTRWSLSASHTRSFKGIPPTGRSVEVAETTIFRLQQGKIKEGWNVSDSAALTEQLMADVDVEDPWITAYLASCI